MIENRIEINGTWYIREDTIKPQVEEINLNPTWYKCVTVEDTRFSYEASIIYKEDGETFYDGVDVKVIDKRVKPWKEEYWDNDSWLINTYKGQNTIELQAENNMNGEDVKFLQAFIKLLIDKGWLKDE